MTTPVRFVRRRFLEYGLMWASGLGLVLAGPAGPLASLAAEPEGIQIVAWDPAGHGRLCTSQ